MTAESKHIEVGHGTADGDDAFTVGAQAAHLAGKQITLHPISAVLVFASVAYNLNELLAGISNVLGNVPIFGTTTAGEICNQTCEKSVVVTILASPYLRVRLGIGKNVSVDSMQAIEEAIDSSDIRPFFSDMDDEDIWSELRHQGKSVFSMLFSPGNTRHADSRSFEILEELKRRSCHQIPFFGGCAADDWKMETNSILYGNQAYPDSLLIAVFETSLRVGIAMEHGFLPSSSSAVATKVNGHEILEFNNCRAADTYAQMLGTDIADLKNRHLTLTTGKPAGIVDILGQYRILVASYFTADGGVRFSQPVTPNSAVTIMEARTENLIQAGQESLRKAIVRGHINRPVLIIAFSCALRQHILGDEIAKEIAGMRSLLPEVPVVGFYSFGEQGQIDAGISCHGNENITTLVLGDELTDSAEVALENQRLLQLQKKNEQFLDAIVENIPDMIFVKDAEQLRFVRFNKAGEDLLGYSRDEMLGKNDYDFFPKDEADFFTGKDGDVLTRGKLVDILEESIHTRFRGKRILHTKKIPILNEDGEAEYLLGISEDITERNKAENLREAKQAAEAASKAKSEFLANMSHEIRTPINAILAFSNILKEGQLWRLNKRQIEFLDHIIDSADRLLTLINDILDLSKVEAGKIEIQPATFKISDLFARIEKMAIGLASKRPVKFQIVIAPETPGHIFADEYRIEQVLRNLISNAIKFTQKGKIEVKVQPRSMDELLFVVNDTGIGIAKDKLDDLFTKFYQIDSSYSKKYSGTGLGLAISKELVELMGGRIWCESKAGAGSSFYFTIQIQNYEKQPVKSESEILQDVEPASPKRNLNILLAEDDVLNRKSMTHFLEREGHKVTSANNGKQVLERLKSGVFDIILMDVQMPEMDGVEATQRIRQSSAQGFDPRIPIIALTAYAMRGDRERFLGAGMNDYVTKPADIDKLLQKMNQLLSI